MDKYFDMLLNKCDEAIENDEVPVAALIVENDKIIAISHNTRVKNNSVLSHAEINCIEETCKIKENWRLDGCDMYVTLKPCDMCMEVIRETRIRNVYYLCDRLCFKNKYNKTIFYNCEDDLKNYSDNYKKKISDFFSKKRGK